MAVVGWDIAYLKVGGSEVITTGLVLQNITGIICSGNATIGGTVITPASTTTRAGLRLPHGAAPTSPVDGDEWSSTTFRAMRLNGVTNYFALSSNASKVTGGAPYTNDGYVAVTIGGASLKLMTTA